jgi:hypothetical protein
MESAEAYVPELPEHILKLSELDSEALRCYASKIFLKLESIKPGGSWDISKAQNVKPENQDLVREIIKFYMDVSEWQGNLVFSSDYKIIKKYRL